MILKMNHSAEAPLMSHQEDVPGDESNPEVSEPSEPGTAQQQRGRIGLFMWLLVLASAISGLLFGYDTGVISATLVSIGTSLSSRELTSLDKSIITSCTSLFALIASPISSVLADKLGRKPVILLADIFFVIGALVQAWSFSVFWMVIGRCIVGAAIGAASFVTPLYIAELSPAAYRGRLVTMNCISITLGQVVAYVNGWAFSEHGDPSTGWRWMVGLGALPAALQCALVLLMPETPRWLAKAGRSNAARRVIQKTSGPGSSAIRMVDGILNSIEAELRQEQESSFLTATRRKGGNNWKDDWLELTLVPKNRRALTIACLLQGLQQLCGFNSLMYFSATIFTLLGFSIPTLTSLSVASTNFLFTVAALLVIDQIGRRSILLYSIPFMVVGLVLSGFGFQSINLPSSASITNGSGTTTTTDAHGRLPQNTAATVILTSMMLYVASYAIGLGNVPWMQSELFSLNVRSLGSGMATATNWLANFVIGLTFLPMMDAMTPTWTFVLYAVICAIGWVLVWMIYPETSGLSLEEATDLLENGWGVK